MIQPAAKSYKQNQVDTAPSEELTLMLYNGAITFVKRAKQAIADRDYNHAHQHITRVQDIVDELIITLDRKYPISEQLLLLYDYLKRRLVESNVSKNISILEEVEGFFMEFRDTWKQAITLARSQKQ
ncbi:MULTISPECIES: flagellar export chaperone FliS [Paenibacillus]|uniref:Flagellar secretion chaperone FliS n=1 Tax=Paenibacillus violae TaxID=3077234 RepID=A0ABU3RND1_9BACL|nr:MULTISPECIES: flagellar export chaperone FliS [Paenibacillus]MDU0205702.1 flagellar export chaperone FliS [Paenibacillus sp. PFR10]MEC0267601.1 flagellar export chaperone FliS [Paenibacillus anseongense]